MELVAEILPVLVALYVVDSALLVRSGQWLFLSGWGGRFQAWGPGLRFPGLLPVAEAVVGATLPVRACAEGVFIPDGRKAERLVAFEAMREVSHDGGVVRLGRGAELPVKPHALAPAVASVLERLRKTPHARRLARLRHELRRRTDQRALASLRAREARMLKAMRALSAASFCAIFLLLPSSLWTELPRRPSPLAALGVVLVLYVATVAVGARLLLDCGVRGRRLVAALLPLLLFPPAVAHAPSIVARELYLDFEPVALARALLAPGAFDRFLGAREAATQRDAVGPAWDLEAIALGLVKKARGRDATSAAASPTDATASARCPRCFVEYRAGFSRCVDCDVTLVRYGGRDGQSGATRDGFRRRDGPGSKEHGRDGEQGPAEQSRVEPPLKR